MGHDVSYVFGWDMGKGGGMMFTGVLRLRCWIGRFVRCGRRGGS